MSVFTTYFIALAMGLKLKKSISDTAMLSITGTIMLIYAFGLADSLQGGVYIFIILTVIAVFYCLIRFIKAPKETLKLIQSPASVAFLAIILFFCVANINRSLSNSDDYLTWGLETKNIYYYNKLHDPRFTSINNYPQATMIWEYLANKTWGSFSESVTLWAYDVYILAGLLPFFDIVVGKNRASKWICMFISILLLPTMAYGGSYGWLSSNTLSSVLCVWGIYCAYQYFLNGEWIYYCALLLDLFCLTMTVRAGFVLIIYPIAYMTFFLLTKRKKGRILKVIILIVTCTLSYFLYEPWRFYLGLFGGLIGVCCALYFLFLCRLWDKGKKEKSILFVFASGLIIAIIYELVFGKRTFIEMPGNRIAALFFNHVFTTSQGTAFNFLPISLSTFLICFLLGIYIYYKKGNRNSVHALNTKLLLLCVLCNLLFLLAYLATYIVFIGAMRISTYSYVLPSFSRYMTPCYLIDIFLALYLFTPLLMNRYKNVYWIGLIAFVLLSVNVSDMVDYCLNKPQLPEYYAFVKSNVSLTDRDKIFYVNLDDDSNNYPDYTFYYSVMPAISNFSRIYARDTDLIITGDEDGSLFCSELAELGYDYVYIQTVNDSFIRNYQMCFTDGNIETGTVYSLIKTQEGYQLQMK